MNGRYVSLHQGTQEPFFIREIILFIKKEARGKEIIDKEDRDRGEKVFKSNFPHRYANI